MEATEFTRNSIADRAALAKLPARVQAVWERYYQIGMRRPISFRRVSACDFKLSVHELDLKALQRMADERGSKVVRDFITRFYLGNLDHLKGLTAVQRIAVEVGILRKAGCLAWGGISPQGKPYHEHFLTLIRLLWPSTDITPTTADAVRMFCWAFSNGRKAMNLIGSQNSSKSGTTARIAFACLVIHPETSSVYVANPFNNTTDSTIWGDIGNLWEDLCTTYTDGRGGCSLFPNAKILATKQLTLVDVPKAGRMEVRSVKKDGSFRGLKAKLNGVGTIIIVIDEINKIEQAQFLSVIQNLYSQVTLFVLTSQNFTDVDNIGGKMAEPSGAYGGPERYDQLNIDKSAAWDSQYSSCTLRFDGHMGVNMLINRTVYPYLLKQEDVNRVALGGLESGDYLSQIRSFPGANEMLDTVLSDSRLATSEFRDTFFAFTNPEGLKRMLFVDPAFGGRDMAMVYIAVMGKARVVEGGGRQAERDILNFPVPYIEIEVKKDMHWTDVWVSRCREIGAEPSGVNGSPLSPEDQVAIQALLIAKREGIPFEHVGYDYSMKDEMVFSFVRYGQNKAHSFNYFIDPVGLPLYCVQGTSTERCRNRNTELAMLASDMLGCRQIRGGANIEVALKELSNTLFIKRQSPTSKMQVESKADYKQRNGKGSPGDRDCFMSMCGLAVKLGFQRGVPGAMTTTGRVITGQGRLDHLYGIPGFRTARPARIN